MTTPQPFSLRIFVADGDPDGLRLVERSNWIGKALVFPRKLYPEVRNRSEFQQTGVYLLLDGEGETIYIGEGDPVRPRLEDHFAKKDFWARVVFFVAGMGQLNKAHVQFLEARLVALAKAAKQVTLENGNSPAEPSLSEADRADMEVFLQNMLGILPVLGVHAFEQETGAQARTGGPTLTCQGKGITATGEETSRGFKVFADSFASKTEVASLKDHFPRVCEHRVELQKNGVLVPDGDRLRFTQDFTFTSPSLAAAVVLGRTANGRIEWKTPSGQTLKQLQEAQVAD
jgi:hypothetical protein